MSRSNPGTIQEWKLIEGYNGKYAISDKGIILSFYNGTTDVKIPNTTATGYKRIRLYKGKGGKNEYVHRLVAKAFLSNKEDKACVNHKNGIKHDNRVENLEWCTRAENNKHAYRTGLIKRNEQWHKRISKGLKEYHKNREV